MSGAGVTTRPRVQALLRTGGERVAASSRGMPRAALVRMVAAALPRFFDAAAARDLVAVVELRIRGPHGGPPSPLALHLDGGTLSVVPGPAPAPQAVMEISAEDMIRMVTGGVGWPALVGENRMALSGDPFLVLRIPALFRLPAG